MHRSYYRIYNFPDPPPPLHLPLARLDSNHQTRGTRRRKETHAPIPHPARALSLQRYELSHGSVTHPETPNIHHLHSTVAAKGDHTHVAGCIDTFF